MKPFPTRAALYKAVIRSLRHDSIADFRRDLDKALEKADQLCNGHFLGQYWADQAIAPLRAIGCDLVTERIDDSQPLFRVKWKGGQL